MSRLKADIAKKLSQTLASRYNVDVVFTSGQPKTDGSTIWINSPEMFKDSKCKEIADGLLDHETAHLIFTEFYSNSYKKIESKVITDKTVLNALKNYHTGKNIAFIANAMEDLRIEHLMGKKYIGCKLNMRETRKYFNEATLKSIKAADSSNSLIGKIGDATYKAFNLPFFFWLFMLQHSNKEMFKDVISMPIVSNYAPLLDKIGKKYINTMYKCSSTTKVYKLSILFMNDLLKEFAEQEAKDKQQNQGQNQSQKQSEKIECNSDVKDYSQKSEKENENSKGESSDKSEKDDEEQDSDEKGGLSSEDFDEATDSKGENSENSEEFKDDSEGEGSKNGSSNKNNDDSDEDGGNSDDEGEKNSKNSKEDGEDSEDSEDKEDSNEKNSAKRNLLDGLTDKELKNIIKIAEDIIRNMPTIFALGNLTDIESKQKEEFFKNNASADTMEGTEDCPVRTIINDFVADDAKSTTYIKSKTYKRLISTENRQAFYDKIVMENEDRIKTLCQSFIQKVFSNSLKLPLNDDDGDSFDLIKLGKFNNWGDSYELNRYRINNNIDKSKSVAVSLLVDASGSMMGDNMELAEKATVMLAETFKRLGVAFEVLAHDANRASDVFETSIYVLKSFYHPANVKNISLLTNLPGRSNRDGNAMFEAYKRLKAFGGQVDRKILIMITDGEPSAYRSSDEGEEHMRSMQKECENVGIEFIAVGMNFNVSKIFGKENTYDLAVNEKTFESTILDIIFKRFLQN